MAAKFARHSPFPPTSPSGHKFTFVQVNKLAADSSAPHFFFFFFLSSSLSACEYQLFKGIALKNQSIFLFIKTKSFMHLNLA